MVNNLGTSDHIYRIMGLATTASVRKSELVKHKFDQS
jgi:hypothetical protein